LRKQKFAETELREELDSMIRGVANVWMPVQDIERAVDFYQNILGFRLVNRDGPWAEVDANGVRVGLNGS
jgi:catechol 2,3-dioxygenase-like lactoylglutathione lyase family enzyme